MGDVKTAIRTNPKCPSGNTPSKVTRRRLRLQQEQQRSPGTIYFVSEALGVFLNICTIIMVLLSYFLVRTFYETTKKIKKLMFVVPDAVCRTSVVNDYYSRAINFLDYRKQKFTFDVLQKPVPDNMEFGANAANEEVANLQEDVACNGSADHDTPPPETPTVVVAEVHTQDTPKSSPRVRFRDLPDEDDETVAGGPRKPLVDEMADSKVED